MKKIIGMMTLLLFISVLASCSFGDSVPKRIYKQLEKAAGLEKDFKQNQAPLAQVAKEEHTLYKEIIALNMDKYDKIVSLSEEAIKKAEKSEQLLKEAKKSIDTAYDEFVKVEELIKKIEDPEQKKKAEKIVELMEKRYEAYKALYDSYQKAIDHDKKLYKMLQKKDLKSGKLEKQVDKMNQTYQEVNKKTETFNQLTEQYNKAKKAFYEATELNIEFE